MRAPIWTENLTRDFGDLRAVDSLSFHVAPGEVYGLLGPNGAGKTTTLRMLSGLLSPSSGNLQVMGASPEEQPLLVKASMGYLTGDTALYGRLTPRETLRFFGRLNNMNERALERRIESLAHELELLDFLDRRTEKLSTGQRQRTAIARAIVHDPPVLVLDEPTSSLDVVSARFILDRLRAEAANNKAVLFSTHHLSEAELICDRIGVLHQGQLLAEGTAEALRSRTNTQSLTEAFLALIAAASREPAV
jgi:sodium transport system ATP-binding protein